MSQTFTLTITMGNQGMQDAEDIAWTLRKVAAEITSDPDHNRIRDINGNTVGSWTITETPDDGDPDRTRDLDGNWISSPDCTVDCAEYGCAGPGGWTHAR